MRGKGSARARVVKVAFALRAFAVRTPRPAMPCCPLMGTCMGRREGAGMHARHWKSGWSSDQAIKNLEEAGKLLAGVV